MKKQIALSIIKCYHSSQSITINGMCPRRINFNVATKKSKMKYVNTLVCLMRKSSVTYEEVDAF
jgi:hypothetical protein